MKTPDLNAQVDHLKIWLILNNEVKLHPPFAPALFLLRTKLVEPGSFADAIYLQEGECSRNSGISVHDSTFIWYQPH